jgi:hypothetical protein
VQNQHLQKLVKREDFKSLHNQDLRKSRERNISVTSVSDLSALCAKAFEFRVLEFGSNRQLGSGIGSIRRNRNKYPAIPTTRKIAAAPNAQEKDFVARKMYPVTIGAAMPAI